ncbi:hypothetical protein [Aureimonas ureilytica]|uniref:hypothetical protein n=1 Tax=Aureimonas ureilytica TaxID=401562 RepID=UPI000378D33D|nr:hypothetical protein [Aureimonas ureilytica]
MLFTKAGRVLAWLLFISGAYRFGMGLYAAITDNQAFVARYIGSRTSGEAIDRGGMLLAAAITLGILTDISRSLQR